MKKILIVKTSSMGDVIHTFPAVTDARAALPDMVIDWAVEPAFADLVRWHPGVRRTWPTPVRRWRRRLLRTATWGEIRDLRRGLRRESYDLVLDAQGLIKSAFIAHLAGGTIAGLDRASARGRVSTFLYAQAHAVPWHLHAADRVRQLFGAALGYAPDLGRIDPGIEGRAPTCASTPRRAFLLHGTTWPSKRWPLAQWIDLSRALLARGYRPAVTFADAVEEATARAIAAAVPEADLISRRPLVEIAGLIAASALVVGVDTGLTHLAAALGRPTVALFASTTPDRTAPRGPRVAVLAASLACAPCGDRLCRLVPKGHAPPCHATIGPPRVLAEIDALS